VGAEPLVSVIIPVYNGEKTLPECLTSVLKQSYNNYEAIVVDNNSTDKTKEIINAFREADKRIRYGFVEKHLTGAVRNEGVGMAQGDILVFTDADCVCPHRWIEEITSPIRLEGEDAVVGFEEDLLKNYWTKNIQKIDELYMQRFSAGKYTRIFDSKNSAVTAKLMRSLMFDPTINITDDLGLAIRIAMKNKIRYLPDVKVGHFHRSTLKSTVNTYFTRAFWSAQVYRKHKKEYSAWNDILFENMSLKKWLVFPFWTLFQFIKSPLGEAYFILVSELSWRVGLLWSMIKRS